MTTPKGNWTRRIEWDGTDYNDDDMWASPLVTGTLIDVKFRDGEIIENIPAGVPQPGMLGREAYGSFWENDGACNDIIAYRVVTK